MIQTVPHPKKEDLRLVGDPVRGNGERAALKVCAPLGAANDAVLSPSTVAAADRE
jgi:hypothetical protein